MSGQEAAVLCETSWLQALDDACEQADDALKTAQAAADSRRPPPNAGALAAWSERAHEHVTSLRCLRDGRSREGVGR